MKALIEKKIEHVASYKTVSDLTGYFKEIRTTIYLLGMPFFHARKFLSVPGDIPSSEIPEELGNALSYLRNH